MFSERLKTFVLGKANIYFIYINIYIEYVLYTNILNVL